MSPRRARFAPPLVAAALAGALAVLPACGPEPTTASEGPPSSAPPADVVLMARAAQDQAGVGTAPADTLTRADAVEVPGLVALNELRTARIGSLVEGNVVEVLVQPGARVGPKVVLANLHSHIVHDAWASFRKAKADERRLAVELKFAADAEARAERLFADKAVALQDLQRAQTNHVAATEALEVAQTEVRRAAEEMEHYGITNGDDPTGEAGEQIPVTSPLSGVVLERLVTQGTAVTPGMPLFVVSDLSTLWVLAEVDEARLAQLRVGRDVQVRVAAYPGDRFAGTVGYIGESVNPKTRRVTVRCDVPNDGRLKPEMYATVLMGEGDPRTMVAVPSSALQTIEGRAAVFVAEDGDRFRVRPVEVGGEQDGLVEIRQGLAGGERVVVAGAFVLKSELLKPGADARE
ncbi:MAG: efflux RND transporter periplasmic adaptor subunit [Vicinamibacterales bacterium]